jgi:hypothetical protein
MRSIDFLGVGFAAGLCTSLKIYWFSWPALAAMSRSCGTELRAVRRLRIGRFGTVDPGVIFRRGRGREMGLSAGAFLDRLQCLLGDAGTLIQELGVAALKLRAELPHALHDGLTFASQPQRGRCVDKHVFWPLAITAPARSGPVPQNSLRV